MAVTTPIILHLLVRVADHETLSEVGTIEVPLHMAGSLPADGGGIQLTGTMTAELVAGIRALADEIEANHASD